MNKSLAFTIYTQNIDSFKQQLTLLKTKRTRIAWLRFLIFIITILAVTETWHNALWVIIVIAVAGISGFLYVVSIDADSKEKIFNLEKLIQINIEEINILQHNYLYREHGNAFAPSHHFYADDLDIVGKASLFQYISRCTAEKSKQLLVNNLLKPSSKENILLKQAAVKELTSKIYWRQQLYAYGMANPLSSSTEERIKEWLKQSQIFTQTWWQWVAFLFPFISLSTVVLYLTDILDATFFYSLVFIFFVFAFSLSKKISATWLLLSRIVPQVNTLYYQLNHLEKETFNNEFISTLKKELQNKIGVTASKEILLLKHILDRFDVRLNVLVFYFLNTFLLWDLWLTLALNEWKTKNRESTLNWFNVVAEIEVVSSFASLAFNQPHWCFPVISDEFFTLNAKNIGHPLIAANKRMDNSFVMNGKGRIALITGSNMAGKSTFLRTLGVNTVLALMGAPVCAEAFTVSCVQLISSMRIEDNLAENTSTFYAELKKLQTIIEAVNRKERIFILLDEILRGTNSFDRHTGSKALIKQLLQQEAVAIIATHDVELASLQNDFPVAITNYHFDVQVTNDELFFDYKLKSGICKSLNASILMKKIGINIS